MLEKYLWITGTLPFILLGTAHLLYTFFTNKFSSRNEQVDAAMKASFPILTKETTMWKAWIGFNASHSAGAIYIGLVNFIMAVRNFSLIMHPVLLCLNMVTVFFYLWLGKRYWFSTPFLGLLVSACCFSIASALILLS